MQSPNLSTPFSFRTEERAERRKKARVDLSAFRFLYNELYFVDLQICILSICITLLFLLGCFQKLEEKFNANEAQKVQLQTTLKVIISLPGFI